MRPAKLLFFAVCDECMWYSYYAKPFEKYLNAVPILTENIFNCMTCF